MRDLKPYIGRRVLLFVGDLTIAGTLTWVGRDAVRMEQASEATSQRQIDGVAVVPISRIDWVQVP